MQTFQQADFEKVTQLVVAEFQIQEAFIDEGKPTYYLLGPQARALGQVFANVNFNQNATENQRKTREKLCAGDITTFWMIQVYHLASAFIIQMREPFRPAKQHDAALLSNIVKAGANDLLSLLCRRGRGNLKLVVLEVNDAWLLFFFAGC